MNTKIKIFQEDNFSNDKIIYGFTGRFGGISPSPYESLNLAFHVHDNWENIEKNRHLLAEHLGFEKEKITWSSQVHGDNLYVLKDEEKIGFIGEYDGIVTNLPDIPIMTLFADCIPILIHDPVKNVIASVHAGWKGTYLGIVEKAIRIMREEYGCHTKDMMTLIGPGICRNHYQVSEEIFKDFIEKFPLEVIPNLEKTIDLKFINQSMIKKTGVTKIYDMNICTYCNNQDFFSFRKENGMTGRFAALIMLKNGEIINESK